MAEFLLLVHPGRFHLDGDPLARAALSATNARRMGTTGVSSRFACVNCSMAVRAAASVGSSSRGGEYASPDGGMSWVTSSNAAVPMVHDHKAIVARVERLEVADVQDVDLLQELLYGLYALISVDLRKEEDLQLPAFDAAPEVAEQVLARMGAAAGHSGHGH